MLRTYWILYKYDAAVVNLVKFNNFASIFNCTLFGRASDNIKPATVSCLLVIRSLTGGFRLLRYSSKDLLEVSQFVVSVESSYLIQNTSRVQLIYNLT